MEPHLTCGILRKDKLRYYKKLIEITSILIADDSLSDKQFRELLEYLYKGLREY